MLTTTFIRKIKTKSGTYLAEVRNKRVDGKVKQEFIRYIGKDMNSVPARRVTTEDVRVMEVRRSLDVEAIDRIARKFGIESTIPRASMVMVYSQLLDRPSISRMQEYLNNTEILRYLNIPSIRTEDL